jgi:ATP-binding cassette subfamily C protein LapB
LRHWFFRLTAASEVLDCASPIEACEPRKFAAACLRSPLENHVIHHLKQYMTAQHTLILVTHKPALLALVDRIIILEDGKIIANGEKETVLKAMFPQQEKAAGVTS